jgi:hypothetical protein
MKVKRKLVFLSVALTAVCLLQNVQATPTSPPTGSKTLQASKDNVEFYYSSTMLAEVDTYVYRYDPGDGDNDYAGDYLYTYQITGKSVIGLSFFSIAIFDPATISLVGYESPGVEPTTWAVANSPAQSVDGLFTDTIDYFDDSALLWFISPHEHTLAMGSIFGTYLGQPAYANEKLYSPIPEPATLVILGIGSLCLIGRKRK